jgi:pimeloyl-ACP methyl ester carboxylesterase
LKPTLVFIHGGPGFKDYLRPFFQGLESHFNCVFYDQLQGKVGVEDLLEQLDTVVRAHPGKKILVGHSWGAILAVEYAARAADQIDALAMICTGLSHKHWNDEFHKELESRGLTNPRMDQIFFTTDELDEGLPFLERIMATGSQETYDQINDTYIGTYDLTEKLRSLKMPVLNIFGGKDVRYPARVCKTFQAINPGIIDFEIPNAGHFPFLRKAGRNQIHNILLKHFG